MLDGRVFIDVRMPTSDGDSAAVSVDAQQVMQMQAGDTLTIGTPYGFIKLEYCKDGATVEDDSILDADSLDINDAESDETKKMPSPKTTANLIRFGIGIIGIFIRLPLSYALTFLILRKLDATDGMWILFWIAVPVAIVFGIVEEFLKEVVRRTD